MKPYLILALLVIAAYANSLNSKFVWDEGPLIVDNPKINLPLKELPSLITTPLWKAAGSQVKQAYYRPTLSAFFVLNYKIWGVNPMGFHLSNIILHLISVMVLYEIGLFLFNNDALLSLIAASIFAVHPVHNEPLGRAASGEVIFGFFIILSIYFFLKDKRYVSWALFSLALLSKEASVLLPFALLILSTHKNGFKKRLIEIMPYMILVGIYLVLRFLFTDTVFGENIKLPILTRIFTMAVAAFDYIRLIVIPYPLKPFYTQRWYASIIDIKVIVAIMVLISIVFLAFKNRKDNTMLFLITFPFIMLAPVIWRVNGFSFGGGKTMYIAERYLYVPVMMFSLFVSAAAVKLFRDERNAKKYLMAGWIIVLLIFMSITISATMFWKDDFTVNQKIIEKSPDAAFAYNNLGLAYKDNGQLDMAIENYNKGIALEPKFVLVYINRGDAYEHKGQYDRAIEDYNKSIVLDPNIADAYYSRGTVYAYKSQYDMAIEDFNRAIQLNKDYADAYYNRGLAYAMKGVIERAIEDFTMVVQLSPNYIRAYTNRGNAYNANGQYEMAASDFRKACDMGSKLGCENLQKAVGK